MWWPGTELNRRRQPFQAAYYQLIPIIFQQLNFAEWPQFCDHSVTSADVRLSVGPNLSRAACPATRPVPGADLVAYDPNLPFDGSWTLLLCPVDWQLLHDLSRLPSFSRGSTGPLVQEETNCIRLFFVTSGRSRSGCLLLMSVFH